MYKKNYCLFMAFFIMGCSAVNPSRFERAHKTEIVDLIYPDALSQQRLSANAMHALYKYCHNAPLDAEDKINLEHYFALIAKAADSSAVLTLKDIVIKSLKKHPRNIRAFYLGYDGVIVIDGSSLKIDRSNTKIYDRIPYIFLHEYAHYASLNHQKYRMAGWLYPLSATVNFIISPCRSTLPLIYSEAEAEYIACKIGAYLVSLNKEPPTIQERWHPLVQPNEQALLGILTYAANGWPHEFSNSKVKLINTLDKAQNFESLQSITNDYLKKYNDFDRAAMVQYTAARLAVVIIISEYGFSRKSDAIFTSGNYSWLISEVNSILKKRSLFECIQKFGEQWEYHQNEL